MTERETEPTGEAPSAGPIDDEVPVEDALEQRTDVAEHEPDRTAPADVEADEADRAEQGRSVDTDDDEYR